MRRFRTSIAVIFLFLLLTLAALASPYSDNFDSDTLNFLPTGWSTTGTAGTGTASGDRVGNGAFYSGAQALSLPTSGAWTWYNTQTYTNPTVKFHFKAASTIYGCLVLRFNGTSTGIVVFPPAAGASAISVKNYVSNTPTTLTLTGGTAQAGTLVSGTWYYLEAQVVGNNISVRCYGAAATPSGWDGTVTSSTITAAGYSGIRQTGGSSNAYVDDFATQEVAVASIAATPVSAPGYANGTTQNYSLVPTSLTFSGSTAFAYTSGGTGVSIGSPTYNSGDGSITLPVNDGTLPTGTITLTDTTDGVSFTITPTAPSFALSPTTLTASGGAQSVTVTGTGTAFAVGTSTQFSVSAGATIASQNATSTTAATFTVDPGSLAGGSTITVTGPSGATQTLTVSAGPATALTLTGPTSGAVNAASTNFTVALSPIGSTQSSRIVTPAVSGLAGSFTPTTVTLSTGAPSATFTFTPTAAGTGTISVTNDGTLTNPSTISYVASSSPLTPGVTTSAVMTPGSNTITISFSGSSSYTTGGTPNYTAQWRRSTDPAGLSPAWANVGSATTGVTATTVPPTLVDNTAVNGTQYYYQLSMTDQSSSVVYYPIIAGEPLPLVSLILIGDSWLVQNAPNAATAVIASGDLLVSQLRARLAGVARVTTSNQGVAGKNTLDWAPTGSLLPAAKTAAPPGTYPIAFIELGINDSSISFGNFSPSTYQTQLQAIVDSLITSGYTKVLLQCPPYIMSQGTNHVDASLAKLVGYQGAIANIVTAEATTNPGKVFNNDPSGLMYQMTMDNYGVIGSDYVHPLGTGNTIPGDVYVSMVWANNIANVLYPVATGTVNIKLGFQPRRGR
ncbi:hypothetical protein CCAX7_000270 [Capsulimonas corticalis]|uniref:Uncharacterized protein n=1 Tax=Capsulimonas corticalis TaxID=2219043 RepID=A0A402CRB1_9BACT|nr:SGNH/GDSL hydrolase family protein [Capsulimonas corticalis]BDI27976.1 hypothetical protein CCAX7_000270 [Capsulimonas corticalis]